MKLRRTIEIVLMLVVLAVATAVFGIKGDTAREAEEMARLADRIAAERQRISELTAEWSVLDHPARIQDLLARHIDVLELRPITANQIDAVELVPVRLDGPGGAATPTDPQPTERR